MMMKKQTPLEKEWTKVEKQELSYLNKCVEKKDSKVNQFLNDRVPAGLQKTLDAAFAKAFRVVFDKGIGSIEKLYKKEQLAKEYQVNEYAMKVLDDRKSLQAFSKKATGTGNANFLLSGVSGIGLGLLGVGVPDIILLTGLMLKSIYEIAVSYGFGYESEEEKQFILRLIRGAVSYGDDLIKMNVDLNRYIENGTYAEDISLEDNIRQTGDCLSKELLYMKFLQGIPIVGAVGGAYDAVFIKRIVKYAEMKYRRRFYKKRMSER